MLTEMVKGRSATEVAALPRDELLDEIGIPLTPVRLKCALLGLSTLKLALHKAKGTPLPEEWAGASSDLELSSGGSTEHSGRARRLPGGGAAVVLGQDRLRRASSRSASTT